MPMPGIYDPDSDEDYEPSTKLFASTSLNSILGRGLVADVLLWKNKYLSAGILIGLSIIWFLFEVAEYHFSTLLCHILMFFMAILFIWSNSAGLIKRDPPTIDDIQLPESTLRLLVGQINMLLSKLYQISSGNDIITFIMTIIGLYILSAFGSLCDTLTLIYIVYLCAATLPALYKQYGDEVDNFAGKSSNDMKNLFEKFNSKFLDKIPRGPTKEKKHA